MHDRPGILIKTLVLHQHRVLPKDPSVGVSGTVQSFPESFSDVSTAWAHRNNASRRR